MPPEGLGPFSAGVVNLALGVGAANMYSDLTSGDKPIMEISLADTTVQQYNSTWRQFLYWLYWSSRKWPIGPDDVFAYLNYLAEFGRKSFALTTLLCP